MKWVVEFEGFVLSRGIIFKEVVIVNITSGEFYFFLLNPPCSFNRLSESDKKIVRYCEKNIHKIRWNNGRHTMKDLNVGLSCIGIGDTVYTKGHQKAEFLRSALLNIAVVVDLDHMGCKNVIQYLDKIKNTKCSLSFHKNSSHCSVIKAFAFRYFLLSQHESVTGKKSNFSSGAE